MYWGVTMIRMFSKWVLIVIAVGVLGAGWSVWGTNFHEGSPMAQAETIRDDLRVIRARLDTCLAAQDRMETRFRSLTRRTERLRERVDAFEAMDPDGVPATHYDEYLDLVDEYNESIPEWERKANGLRQYASGCRELVEFHNSWADSLRQTLAEAGVWDESWGSPPTDDPS